MKKKSIKKYKVVIKASKENRPVAIVVKKGTFDSYNTKKQKIEMENDLVMREKSLEIILNQLDESTLVVSTTGKTSREIFEIRKKN